MPETAEIVAIMVARVGYATVVAGTFTQAMQLARETRFDLVLCDITLPDGDGCELYMRLNELYPIPGVALTGNIQHSDLERYRKTGFADQLAKPFTMDALRNAIVRVITPFNVPQQMPDHRLFI